MNEPYRSEPHNFSRSVPSAFDTTYNTDTPMPYPPSPYYSSVGSEADLDYSKDDFGSALGGASLALMPPRSFTGSPLSQGMAACGDTGYILELDPSEPLFTNSPSPTADEPRTPDSRGRWEEDMALGGCAAYTFDTPYSEFPL